MLAKQVDRAIRQGVEAHLCVVQLELNEGEIQCIVWDACIKGLLDEYQNVMPPQLPSELSPKRAVDNKL